LTGLAKPEQPRENLQGKTYLKITKHNQTGKNT